MPTMTLPLCMVRCCNARTLAGGRCRRRAMPGRLRCRLHGSAGGRPRGIPLRPHENAALQAARARWIERMRLAKARGLIAKFPNGRRPRGSAPRSKDKAIARAQRMVEEIKVAKTASGNSPQPAVLVPVATPTLPAHPLSKADKHSAAAILALDVVQQILALGVDPSNVKLLAQVKDTALTVIAQHIRLDEARMRDSEEDRRSLERAAALAQLAREVTEGRD